MDNDILDIDIFYVQPFTHKAFISKQHELFYLYVLIVQEQITTKIVLQKVKLTFVLRISLFFTF